MSIRESSFWIRFAMILVIAAAFSACELDEVDPPERNDSTFPEVYVGSLGNSLTAGYQNAGLRCDGQYASFANLLSKRISGREMEMPLVDFPGLGIVPGFTPLFVEIGLGGASITREPLTVPLEDMLKNATYPLPYDNLGIPGATANQLRVTRYGNPLHPDHDPAVDAENAFFDLILRNHVPELPFTPRPAVEQLAFITPEAVTVWAGNNEILFGAMSGEPQVGVNILPSNFYGMTLIPLLDAVEAIGAEMVAVANIPPLTSIAMFNLWQVNPPGAAPLRWNMVEDHDDNGDPDVLDSDPVVKVLLEAPLAVETNRYIPGLCELEPGGCLELGPEYTLSASEVETVDDVVLEYNALIANEIAARGWAAVDAHALFLTLPADGSSGPLNLAYPLDLVAGVPNLNSVFTLDGIHPSERGHGLIANTFLEAINTTYGTSYAGYDLSSISNVAGLEQLLAIPKQELGPVSFSEEGLEGIRQMREMMRGRF